VATLSCPNIGTSNIGERGGDDASNTFIFVVMWGYFKREWAKRLYDPFNTPSLDKTSDTIRECLDKISVHGKKLSAGPLRFLTNFCHREQDRVFTRITRSKVKSYLDTPV
jgi:hypothetical protein